MPAHAFNMRYMRVYMQSESSNATMPPVSNEHDGHRHKIWRVWLKLYRGGYMGLPYPARNETRARALAEKAGYIFGGDVECVEYLGEM